MLLIIIFGLVILAIGFNLFVYLLGKKINNLEEKTIKLFQIRTSLVVGIFETTKDELVKPNEIFEEFFELKRRDFSEDSFNISLENKLVTYRRIHNEINFIFKTCEQHKNIKLNPIYIYLKDRILNVSNEIGSKMKIYNSINEKYIKYKNITKLMLFGYLY